MPALCLGCLLPGVLWGSLPSSQAKLVLRVIGITATPQSGGGGDWLVLSAAGPHCCLKGLHPQPVRSVPSSALSSSGADPCRRSTWEGGRGELLLRPRAACAFFGQLQIVFGFFQGFLFQPQTPLWRCLLRRFQQPSPWCNATVPHAICHQSLVL